MKSAIVLGFAIMLLTASIGLSASKEDDKLKVLVDESRVHAVDEATLEAYVSEIEETIEEIRAALRQLGLNVTIEVVCDEHYSFNNLGEPWGFGLAGSKVEETASITTRESGTLSYAVLMKYDVLVIASFEKEYAPAEVDAIKKFVENGGGLLLFADIESQNNSVSHAFDVSFSSDRAIIADEDAEGFGDDTHMFYVTDIVNHPVTRDIDKIALNGGIPIVSYKSGKVLASTSGSSWIDHEGNGSGTKDREEEEGPFDILLANENAGRGRTVFFGGAMSFWNEVTLESGQQNLDLFANAIEWLGKPGGPYKQYKVLNEHAQELVQDAMSLYETHKLSEAKETFQDAIDAFEESNEMYANSEAIKGIEDTESYLEKCETGLKANQIFERAEDLFKKQEYEKAIEEYENAISLYSQIEYTEKIEECTTRIDESNQWIYLREEAASLFSQAEDALSNASRTSDQTDYETAKSLFEQSKRKWEEYNDPAQVEACEEKIELCNDEIAHIKRMRTMIIVAAVVAVVGVMAAAFIFIRRRKQTQK